MDHAHPAIMARRCGYADSAAGNMENSSGPVALCLFGGEVIFDERGVDGDSG